MKRFQHGQHGSLSLKYHIKKCMNKVTCSSYQVMLNLQKKWLEVYLIKFIANNFNFISIIEEVTTINMIKSIVALLI